MYMKISIFVGVLVALVLVASAFIGYNISFMSILNNLASSSELTSNVSADLFLKRVYDVPTSVTDFTISSDWGAFNFLRPVLLYMVRGFGVILDLGNYIIWFVRALWTGLLYMVSLVGLLLGLG